MKITKTNKMGRSLVSQPNKSNIDITLSDEIYSSPPSSVGRAQVS